DRRHFPLVVERDPTLTSGALAFGACVLRTPDTAWRRLHAQRHQCDGRENQAAHLHVLGTIRVPSRIRATAASGLPAQPIAAYRPPRPRTRDPAAPSDPSAWPPPPRPRRRSTRCADLPRDRTRSPSPAECA